MKTNVLKVFLRVVDVRVDCLQLGCIFFDRCMFCGKNDIPLSLLRRTSPSKEYGMVKRPSVVHHLCQEQQRNS